MKKSIKLFEEFNRTEELPGFKLVKKMNTEEFMRALIDGGIKSYGVYYRLVNYTPGKKYTWAIKGEVLKPIPASDKRTVTAKTDDMYKSPIITLPDTVKFREYPFFQDEDGSWVRYTGKSAKKLNLCNKYMVTTFNALSLSAYIGNRTSVEFTDDDWVRMSAVLNDLDNGKVHESTISSTRNYCGYAFDEVFVYQIEDVDAALETIIDECDNTVV